MGAYTIPIYDTDGVLRDIPADKAHEAVANGGKPGVRFQAPDGKVRYVPADQTQDALSNGGKLLPFEQQDEGIKQWYGFTPSNVAKNVWEGAKGIIGGTYEIAKDLVNNPNWVQGDDSTFHKFIKAPSDEQVKKASAALEAGNHVEAAGHILASALPLVGPWAAGLGEQAGKGDIGGAVGQGVGTVVGGAAQAKALQLASRGIKAGVPKAAALVKTGTTGAIEAVGAQVAPEPHELMTRAVKPTAGNTEFDTAIQTAMPELKAAETDIGRPVRGVTDALEATSAAKKKVWAEYQAKLDQAKAVDAGPLQTRDPQTGQLRPVTHEPTINGNDIADAMEASVTKRQAQLNPGLAERVKKAAATYRRPMTLDEAEDFLQDANNELHSYYAKNKVGRRAAAADPETASTVAEAEQLRNSLYSKLDELTGEGAADIKKRYGALSNVENELLRRKNVAARQQPESLAEQIGKAAGIGKVVAGAGLTLAGSPGAGAALAGEGAMQAGLSKWLKGRQTTDAMIERAFKDYGQEPSKARQLLRGERGEAGAPGTVTEEPERPEPAPPVPQAERRTPEQTRADITAGIARDPQLAALEAAQRGRAREIEQRYPVEAPQPVSEAITPPPKPGQKPVPYYEKYGKAQVGSEEPNVEPFYSKAEKAAKMLPGSASGQQMLATLKNQGVKPGELEQMGIEDFLKSKAKFTRQEVADFIARNKLQVGEKDLGQGEDLFTLQRNRQNDWDIISTDSADKGRRMGTIAGHMDETEARNFARSNYTSTSTGNTKYESYTLPGEKQNYTEKLFTLPSKVNAEAYAREVMGEREWSRLGPTERRQLIQSAAKNTSANFQSSHWDEPNVLAHARFDERTAADGKKVLFLEEAQSDWHQKGKKEGYQQQNPSADQLELAITKLRDPKTQRAYSIADAREMASEAARLMRESDKTPSEALHEAGLPDGHINLVTESLKSSLKGVPDAPFKTDWHELVVKRMLREAAERGADRLAWTTGDQQAERYDLSKQVGKVQYNEAEKTLVVYNQAGSRVIKHIGEVPPEKLADYIGKEPAQKLLSAPKEGSDFTVTRTNPRGSWDVISKNGKYIASVDASMTEQQAKNFAKSHYSTIAGWQEIKGDGLKVGGEWAKALYDRAIPNFLNKYAKKWGARVGTTDLANEPAKSPETGSQYYSLEVPKQKVHSIDITPAMRKAVLKEGQPIASAATFGEERPA